MSGMILNSRRSGPRGGPALRLPPIRQLTALDRHVQQMPPAFLAGKCPGLGPALDYGLHKPSFIKHLAKPRRLGLAPYAARIQPPAAPVAAPPSTALQQPVEAGRRAATRAKPFAMSVHATRHSRSITKRSRTQAGHSGEESTMPVATEEAPTQGKKVHRNGRVVSRRFRGGGIALRWMTRYTRPAPGRASTGHAARSPDQ